MEEIKSCILNANVENYCMEYIIVWNISLYGVYHCMEYIIVWSILLYGVGYYMEYIMVWSISLYGAYYCMEYIIVQLTIDNPQPLMMVLTDYIDR